MTDKPKRYKRTADLLERRRKELTEGIHCIPELHEALDNAKKEVESLTKRIAEAKAELNDIDDSLALLKAGA